MEDLIEDGVTGLLVEPTRDGYFSDDILLLGDESAKRHADAGVALVESGKLRSMGDAAKVAVERSWSLEKYVDRHASLLERVVKEQPSQIDPAAWVITSISIQDSLSLKDQIIACPAAVLDRQCPTLEAACEATESPAVERVADPLFRMLHVTDNVPYYDRGVTPLSSHAVRFQFKLPSSASRMEELQSLTKLAIDFADKVASFRLTREGSKKNTQARKTLQDAKRKDQEQGSESSSLNKQREVMAAKDAELRRLQRTDPKEFKKQMKRLEGKMMRKKTKMASK
jgi:hypothetical protein